MALHDVVMCYPPCFLPFLLHPFFFPPLTPLFCFLNSDPPTASALTRRRRRQRSPGRGQGSQRRQGHCLRRSSWLRRWRQSASGGCPQIAGGAAAGSDGLQTRTSKRCSKAFVEQYAGMLYVTIYSNRGRRCLALQLLLCDFRVLAGHAEARFIRSPLVFGKRHSDAHGWKHRDF